MAALLETSEPRSPRSTTMTLVETQPALSSQTDDEMYKWLDETNLTPDRIETSLNTYAAAAESYSELEWEKVAFGIMWRAIWHKHLETIQNLPEKAWVLEVGNGSISASIPPVMISRDSRVISSDVTPQMLQVGKDKLVWDHIEFLAKFMATTLLPGIKESDDWVSEVVKIMTDKIETSAQFQKLPWILRIFGRTKDLKMRIAGFNEDFGTSLDEKDYLITPERITEGVKERIILNQDNIRNLPYKSNSIDMITCLAVLPHLTKAQTLEAIRELLRVLKPGGVLIGNVKASQHPETDVKGHVFRDKVLGPDLERYFNTYSTREFKKHMRLIKNGFPNVTIKVERELSPHFDPNKPKFINFMIIVRK